MEEKHKAMLEHYNSVARFIRTSVTTSHMETVEVMIDQFKNKHGDMCNEHYKDLRKKMNQHIEQKQIVI